MQLPEKFHIRARVMRYSTTVLVSQEVLASQNDIAAILKHQARNALCAQVIELFPMKVTYADNSAHRIRTYFLVQRIPILFHPSYYPMILL